MHDRVFSRQCFRGGGQPLHQAGSRAALTRWKRLVREPPEESESGNYGHETVEKEHPSEACKSADAVHELEAGRDEANYRRGDLRSGEVHADSFSGS